MVNTCKHHQNRSQVDLREGEHIRYVEVFSLALLHMFCSKDVSGIFWGRGIEYRSLFSSFLIIGCNLMLRSDDCFLFNLTILVLDPFRRAHTAPMDQFAAFSGAVERSLLMNMGLEKCYQGPEYQQQ